MSFRVVVGCEDDPLAVGRECRAKAGRAQIGDLFLAAAIGLHDPDFKRCGPNQILPKQFLVVCNIFFALRMVRAIDDPLAVRRKRRTTVVAEFVGQLFHVLAIGIHRVNIEIAIAHRSEHDLLPVERNRRFGIVALRISKLLQFRAIGVRGEDVVSRIDSPNIALRKVRTRRALRIRRDASMRTESSCRPDKRSCKSCGPCRSRPSRSCRRCSS